MSSSSSTQQQPPFELVEGAELRAGGKKGRGVFARRSFSPGERVVSTRDYVAALSNDELLRRCSACFRAADDEPAPSSSGAIVSSDGAAAARLSHCTACKVVSYCSSACQLADWHEVHKQECAALRRFAKEAQAARNKPGESSSGASGSGGGGGKGASLRFPDTPVRALGRIIWRSQAKERRDSEWWREVEWLNSNHLLLDAQTQAQHMHLCMALGAFIGPETIQARFPDARALLDLASRFSSNSFALTDSSSAKAPGQEIGVALCVSAAAFNHSCEPNATVTFVHPANKRPASNDRDEAQQQWQQRPEARVSVIKRIEPGQEINVAYVDIAEARETRRRDLRAAYQFDCECDSCVITDNDGEVVADARESFTCHARCSSFNLHSNSSAGSKRDDLVSCEHCGETLSSAEARARAKGLRTRVDELERLSKESPEVACERLLELVRSRDSRVPLSASPVVRALHLAQDALLRSGSPAFMLARAQEAFEPYIAAIKTVYPFGYPERVLAPIAYARCVHHVAFMPDSPHASVNLAPALGELLLQARDEVGIAYGPVAADHPNRSELARFVDDLLQAERERSVLRAAFARSLKQ